MMIRLLIFLASLFLFGACASSESVSGTRAERVVSEIHDPSSNKVLVACHRGDWRNWPENSLAAIESVIGMGADIVEIDLALTSDSVLVVCHDRTLNRTTTGKGLIAEIPYDSIQRCFLKSGHGVATSHRMPTLREALELCKDRIVVNIDKGYQYYDLVQRLSEELGVTGQLLIKGKSPVADVAAKFSRYEHNMMYMPIIDILKPKGQALFAEYLGTDTVPLAYPRSRSLHEKSGGRRLETLGELPVAVALRRSLRRCGLRRRPGGRLRQTRRYGRHHDPDRPSRTADLLPPRTRTARLTP